MNALTFILLGLEEVRSHRAPGDRSEPSLPFDGLMALLVMAAVLGVPALLGR